MYKNQTRLNQFVHLASLLVRVEEVARERYGQHSGCGTRSYLRTPGRLASGVQLPWEVEDEMSYSCTSKCAPFEISLAVVCWLRECASAPKPRGNSGRCTEAPCYSRPDGGQPFSRFTLASS